jgi:imidazoleglycerol-phosphate dehydratase
MRTARIERKTRETEILVQLKLDEGGPSVVDTGIGFMDHMLDLMTAHGFMQLELKARGDRNVDDHHTVEDLGICLGQAINKALGNRQGIRRYGEATIPMDEALARVVIDLSNRPFLAYKVVFPRGFSGTFDMGLLKEFFRALTIHAGMTVHIDLLAGEEPHHISEAVFKGFGRAIDQAATFEERLAGILPSTKGIL